MIKKIFNYAIVFTRMLYRKKPKIVSNKNRGLLYIAFGDTYIKEAINSFSSIIRNNDFPGTIFCDKIVPGLEIFENVNLIKPRHKREKVEYLSLSPYEKTLYLDSDTLAIDVDLNDLFQLLDNYEIALTHDFARYRYKWGKLIDEYRKIPECYSEFNGGLILFKMPNAEYFFDLWRKYFYKYYLITKGWDQASLRLAIYKSNLKLYVLPVEYNVRSNKNRQKANQTPILEGGKNPLNPKIIHWHGVNLSNYEKEIYKY